MFMPFRHMYPMTTVANETMAHSVGLNVCVMVMTLSRIRIAASTISPGVLGSGSKVEETGRHGVSNQAVRGQPDLAKHCER